MITPVSLPWILWMATASCSAQTLVIGLYDYSDLSAKETVRLTETADLVFAHSGIRLVWHQCHGTLAATIKIPLVDSSRHPPLTSAVHRPLCSFTLHR